jgi:hypothetical protein
MDAFSSMSSSILGSNLSFFAHPDPAIMLWSPAQPIILFFFVISLYPFAGGGAMVNHIIHIIPLVAEKGRIFG